MRILLLVSVAARKRWQFSRSSWYRASGQDQLWCKNLFCIWMRSKTILYLHKAGLIWATKPRQIVGLWWNSRVSVAFMEFCLCMQPLKCFYMAAALLFLDFTLPADNYTVEGAGQVWESMPCVLRVMAKLIFYSSGMAGSGGVLTPRSLWLPRQGKSCGKLESGMICDHLEHLQLLPDKTWT